MGETNPRVTATEYTYLILPNGTSSTYLHPQMKDVGRIWIWVRTTTETAENTNYGNRAKEKVPKQGASGQKDVPGSAMDGGEGEP